MSPPTRRETPVDKKTARLEAALRKFPRRRLAFLPTPLEKLTRLPAPLSGCRIHLKRDDQTGLAFGGNKTRKLEYIMAAARARNADCIITWGGLQSNWCRQTAAAAARCGLKAILILFGQDDTRKAADGNHLLDTLLGAEIIREKAPGNGQFFRLQDIRDTVDRVVTRARRTGQHPYVVPIGGSMLEGDLDKPLGAVSYTAALLEMAKQAKSLGISLDTIVLATGSASTQAGLIAGVRMLCLPTRIVGISVTVDALTMRKMIEEILDQTLRHLEFAPTGEYDDIEVVDDYLAGGYGELTPGIVTTIHSLAASQGILLDPVYTGKAFWGLTDLIRRGYFQASRRIVFLHTGGTPALFPYRESLTGI